MQKELAIIIQKTTKQIVEIYPPLSMSEETFHASTHHPLYKTDSREAKLLQDLLQVKFFVYNIM